MDDERNKIVKDSQEAKINGQILNAAFQLLSHHYVSQRELL